MSKDKYNAPQGSDSEFVDEILAEARKMRGMIKIFHWHRQDLLAICINRRKNLQSLFQSQNRW